MSSDEVKTKEPVRRVELSRRIKISLIAFGLFNFIAVGIGFINYQNLQDETSRRNIQACETTNDARNGTYELVRNILIPTPNPDGTPRVLTPAQEKRNKDLLELTRRVLPIIDCSKVKVD